MDFDRENKLIINSLYDIKSQTADMKEYYKNNFPLLMTTTTRHKLFSNFIKIFKLIKERDIISCWRLMPRIYKQIRIHKTQLKKVEKKSSYDLNVRYLDDIVKVILNQLFYYNKK